MRTSLHLGEPDTCEEREFYSRGNCRNSGRRVKCSAGWKLTFRHVQTRSVQ